MNSLILALVFALTAAAAPNPDGPMVTIGGSGKVAVVNTCGASEPALSLAAKKVGNILMIKSEVQPGAWTFATAAEAMKRTEANVAVFVVRDASLPISLIAMESKWGVVNATGMTDKQLEKEVMRVATVLLGAANSKYSASSLRPAYSIADLDQAGELITFDSLMAIFPNLEKLGIKQFQSMSYRDACYEGVAPEARTDIEKKIAAEVADELKQEAAKSGK